MPEGPEIHRDADRLADVLVDRVVTDIYFEPDELEDYEDELVDLRIIGVEARGKALLTRFENQWNLFSHNQLYGKWIICDADDTPDTDRKLRVEIRNESYAAYLFSATKVDVLRDDELPDHSYLGELGPDPLRDEIDEGAIVERYRDESFHRRQLGSLLLDQGFVAGVGNYLRTEILWYAAVHPRDRLSDLDEETHDELAEGTCKLMQRAYENNGVTNDPERVDRLREEGASRREYRHFAYGREDRECFRCGGTIVREEHNGRRVFLCDGCQTS
jgi:endonuclease-8